jgi:hypothetical protein
MLLRWIRNQQLFLDSQWLGLLTMVTRPLLCDIWSHTYPTVGPTVSPLFNRINNGMYCNHGNQRTSFTVLNNSTYSVSLNNARKVEDLFTRTSCFYRSFVSILRIPCIFIAPLPLAWTNEWTRLSYTTTLRPWVHLWQYYLPTFSAQLGWAGDCGLSMSCLVWRYLAWPVFG